jgi:hypothetical protein
MRQVTMRRVVAVIFLAVLFSGAAWGQKKPKDVTVPGVILHARYVYVTAFTGDQMNPRVMPEDRAAINEVIDALKKWGRYAVTYDAKNADLTIVVRRGNIAAARVGGGVSTGSTGTVPFGAGGLEGGSPDDILMVMEGGGPPLDTSALWRRSAKNGLDGPDPALVEAFKKDVEQAAGKKP